MRIKRIEVDNLFHQYSYAFGLEMEDRVTIIYGTNGTGKTTVLRMLDALFQRQHEYLATIDFKELRLTLESQQTVVVRPEPDYVRRSEKSLAVYALQLEYELLDPDGKVVERELIYLPDPNRDAMVIDQQVRRIDPQWILLELGMWKHAETSEELTLSEMVSRYSLWSLLAPAPDAEGVSWLNDLLPLRASRFLGTGRLSAEALPGRVKRARVFRNAVEEQSARIVDAVGQAKAAYYRAAQELDAGLGVRIVKRMTDESWPIPEVHVLQGMLTRLANQRRDLEKASVLDPASSESLDDYDPAQGDPNIRKVLEVYVDSAAEKLAPLQNLYNRMRGLERTLTAKLKDTGKTVHVTGTGIRITKEDNRELPLELLSSGEQHELVMDTELYFGIQSGTMLLIDEPENSLHVAWQSLFIDDLLAICEISDIDALIATHAPALIGEYWRLTRSFDPAQDEAADLSEEEEFPFDENSEEDDAD